MPDSDLKFPSWQIPLQDLLLETDPRKLLERVHTTEKAIIDRLQQLQEQSGAAEEREGIKEALEQLRIIKRHKLGFPDWEVETRE